MSGHGRRAVLGGLAGALAAPARAQEAAPRGGEEAWPARPLRLVVPFPPGSTPDIVARSLAEPFREAFGVPCVVENRAGAGGTIGTGLVAQATDGHTIGVSINAPVTTAKGLYPGLAYDPERDLALVSLLVRAPQLLVVRDGLAAADPAAFLALATREPGRLTYGSPGSGSAAHLAMAQLEALRGVALTHVPYRGFPPIAVDLLAGRLDCGFSIVAAMLPHVREGRLRALGVTGPARFPLAPDLPTLAEGGLPGLDFQAWNGLVAPASTPPAVVARLAAAAAAALARPAARAALEAAGFEVVGSGPAAFAALVETERREWGALIRRLGITADG